MGVVQRPASGSEQRRSPRHKMKLQVELIEGPRRRTLTTVDVSRLPINLERIQRQLRQSSVRDESDGLRLRYVVDVFAPAPRIELFGNRDFSLTGPAPYGAPTHQDLLQVITPQEYRAPVANFGNLFRWLSDRAKRDKSNK